MASTIVSSDKIDKFHTDPDLAVDHSEREHYSREGKAGETAEINFEDGTSTIRDLESFDFDEGDVYAALEDDDGGCCGVKCCRTRPENRYSFQDKSQERGITHINRAFEPDGTTDSPSSRVDTVMELDQFRDWLDALCNDDTHLYDKLIQRAKKATRKTMINGRFRYTVPMSVPRKVLKHSRQQFERPICLAAASASRDVFQKLLQDKVYVVARDKMGCNVVHALALAEADSPQLSDEFTAMYAMLLEHLDPDTIRVLLLGETLKGEKPLELAAQLGAYGMFRAILSTPRFYGKILCHVGSCVLYRFNLSDYEDVENSKRSHRSPLRSFCSMNDAHYKSFVRNKIDEIPVIKKWMKRKFLDNLWLLLIWFFIRLANVIICLLVDPASLRVHLICNQNASDIRCTSYSPQSFLLVSTVFAIITGGYSAFVIMFDSGELFMKILCHQQRGLTSWTRLKSSLGSRRIYRICHHLLAVTTIIVVLVGYLYTGNDLKTVAFTCKSLTLPFLVMDICFLLEPAPIIGKYVMTMQIVVKVLIKYIISNVFIGIIFAVYFYVAVNGGVYTVNPDDYSNFGDALFNIFKIHAFQSVVDKHDDIAIKLPAFFLSFLSVALIINFISSVLLDIVQTDSKKLEIERNIIKLHLSLTIEDRFGWNLKRINCVQKQKMTGYFVVPTYLKHRHGHATTKPQKQEQVPLSTSL